MPRNNRTAGHNYERQIMNELKDFGFSAVTSRNESKTMDDRGVDIISDAPVHIQCKNSQTNQDYPKLLNSELLPTDKPTVVFHKKTKKVGERFMPVGEFIIIKKEDFYKLINWNAAS